MHLNVSGLFLILAFLVLGCSPGGALNDLPLIDDDIRIELSELPQAARDYLEENYPGVEVRWIKMDGDGDTRYFYEVKLNNGREIYFDEDGAFVAYD